MDRMMRDNYFIEDWINTMMNTVKLIYPDIPNNELEDYLCQIIDNNIKVPVVTLDNNYNKTNKRVNALTLMQWVKDNNFIIAGNGTIFKNHYQEYNPSIHFLIDV